jgi:hypothetical protein
MHPKSVGLMNQALQKMNQAPTELTVFRLIIMK